ncbi:MAG: hypothetical protein JNM86_09645 [Phycisphaerae bacterium]|nr:hypothetical protein [Phycisphaerae bacterium]MBN8597677.1 hypothetical protein [Planctomycetota bacterium]
MLELAVVAALILVPACLLRWAMSNVRAAVQSPGKPPEQKQPEPPEPQDPPRTNG